MFNPSALWRMNKIYNFDYPITTVGTTHPTKKVSVDLKKYLTGTTDTLSRLFIRIHGSLPVVGVGSKGAGTATGRDNPYGLLVSANLATSPIYKGVTPINAVSARGLSVDAMFDQGTRDTAATALTDTEATKTVDQWYEINFKRTDVVSGVEYGLALGKYTSLPLDLVFGGKDQLFTGGDGNTWNLSGLVVDIWADLDNNLQPDFIHASELFEIEVPVTVSNSALRIDSLSAGFVYGDIYILSEEANALADGIINNISVSSGGQVWLPQGESNAAAVKQMFTRRNQRSITDAAQVTTGIYGIPMRDGMFTRAYDQRFAPPLIVLDVTAGSATKIRIVGRRMIPGGIFVNPKAKNKNR